MSIKNKDIPTNRLPEEFETGIAVGHIHKGRGHSFETSNSFHRHDYHIFLLVRKGRLEIEIDFGIVEVSAPSLMYIHPTQVHRIMEGDAEIDFLGINNENIESKYLQLLEEIVPAAPVKIDSETQEIGIQLLNLCEGVLEKKFNRYRLPILQHCGNAFLGLALDRYAAQEPFSGISGRHEQITKDFRLLLEKNFLILKRPSEYADRMNLSTPYLNESVRKATGLPVSQHIQQRVLLEAKRLLFHSTRNVKEIAFELGFEDHTYFSRLFSKSVGLPPLAFRRKYFD